MKHSKFISKYANMPLKRREQRCSLTWKEVYNLVVPDSDDFSDIPEKDRKKLAKTIAEIKIPEAKKGDKKMSKKWIEVHRGDLDKIHSKAWKIFKRGQQLDLSEVEDNGKWIHDKIEDLKFYKKK